MLDLKETQARNPALEEIDLLRIENSYLKAMLRRVISQTELIRRTAVEAIQKGK